MSEAIRAALGLLTRLPVRPGPVLPHHGWAFPLAGLAVGGLAALVFWIASALGLPPGPAAALGLAAQIVLTGALHEDGLADCADGFWGGHTRERRLEIMRDSRVGSYGVLAIGLSLLIRWSALAVAGPLALVAAAVASRAALLWPMHALPHARADGLARLAGRPDRATLGRGCALALALCLPFAGWHVVTLAIALVLAAPGCAALARAKIGGQTGDVLGATQQVTEMAALLVLAAVAA
ncbi:adenosylcobinamide-GDP ribazoletransferase [Limimaricola pyoseonensis]|uniref:Adenosylcobinamide-GDP ribazoletransferase n=1 Tax=Limimaricola pyoseonensis TaxID=521013 RepID=A0A1G7CXC1_9RHOB|nr:adenosylcobinamide-GDP ribazoletransferase [Limimaricola pyoseonensis]SDE43947.1 cobalamin-5'-phosphate synthase [Limimaricola pyoseonensis]